jgi:hypothetical protein
MPIEWMRHCDVYPDIPESDVDFVAFDDDQIVGRVMQFEFGPENGVFLDHDCHAAWSARRCNEWAGEQPGRSRPVRS